MDAFRRRLRFALVLAGWPAITLSGCDAPPPAPPRPHPVRVAAVHLEPADGVTSYAAVIRPRIEVDMGFRVGGKMAERLVEAGSRVEPGTPLARLDPADLDLQVRSAEAQFAAAKADAANAQAEFDRYSRLGEWTTRQELDRRRTTLERARARVDEAAAALRLLRNNATYSVLRADAPGVVTAVLAEPGQVVAAGQPVMRLARSDALEAEANLPEQDAAAIGSRELSVAAWALPGVSIAGSLRELSPSADPVTRTYRARIALSQPPAALQIGMTATLTAVERRPGNVARLPLSALTQQGKEPAVWVVNAAGDGVVLRPVRVAAYAGDWAILAGGVAEGERVVTAGVHKLDAGQKIRVWSEPQR